MKASQRIMVSVALLALTAFAGLGLLASLEPTTGSWLPWRIGYAVLGLASLGGTILLWRSGRRD